MQIKMRDGVEIYCEYIDECTVSEAPVVVVFPGGPGFDASIYKPQLEFLKDRYKLLFFDPRGCGRSTALESQQYTFDVFSDDVAEILKHLGIEKVGIIGTSFGAMAGLHYAIKNPDQVETLICIGGSPSYHFLAKAKENLMQVGTDDQQQVCEKLLWSGQFKTQDDYLHYMQLMSPLYAISLKGTTQNPYRLTCNLDALNQFFANQFERFDFTNALSKITASTLWMVGEHDWINDPCLIEPVVSTIPECCFEVVVNSGHSISKDQNHIYKSLISDFLRCHYDRVNRPGL